MLACSLCLVNSEEPKLRGTIVTEHRLEEEGLARNSVTPTKKKTTRTTTKKKKTAVPTTATEPEKTMSPVNDEDKKSEQANSTEDEATQDEETAPDVQHEEASEDGYKPEDEYKPKGKANLDDESQADEEQPTESQGPDESPQGTTQEDVSQEDEKQSDESQHKSKGDESETPSDATTDPCVKATTCSECEKAASNSTLDEQTCVWKDSLCKLVPKGEVPSETKCDEHEAAAHNTTASQDFVPEEEEEGSSVPLLVTITVVLGVLVALRTYLKNHGVLLFSGGGMPGVFRQQGLSPRGSRHTETYVVISRSCDGTILSHCPVVFFVAVSRSQVWMRTTGDGMTLVVTLSSQVAEDSRRMTKTCDWRWLCPCQSLLLHHKLRNPVSDCLLSQQGERIVG